LAAGPMRRRATCRQRPEYSAWPMNPARANGLLRAGGLPNAWQGLALWRILALGADEADEFDGAESVDSVLTFLACWRLWRATRGRPARLHYVLIVPHPPDFSALRRGLAKRPVYSALAYQLEDQCTGLSPGFQRLTFDDGRVLLTLCIGEMKAMLRAQQFQADSVLLASGARAWRDVEWNRWTSKALAQCCRPACVVVGAMHSAGAQASLAQNGFELAPFNLPDKTSGMASEGAGVNPGFWRCRFAPRWHIKTSRQPLVSRLQGPGRCAVIGAGLAGTSVAAALALRGWQVQVLDAADEPAQGASGLPVGLLCPDVSRDDNPRSRLSRAGLSMTLRELAARTVEGRDWGATGVLQRTLADGGGEDSSLWHPQAAWVKPQALIRSWLGSPGVQFQGGARVAALHHSAKGWDLLGSTGKHLASADVVVIAAAGATQQLLSGTKATAIALLPLKPLRAMHGQLSWGLHPKTGADALPTHPVNGHGHLVAHVPQTDGLTWYAGATYESTVDAGPDAADVTAVIAAGHAANFSRLQRLLPEAAQALRAQFESPVEAGPLGHWRNTRYATPDRLPVAGPLMAGDQPSLWGSTAFGSRGLTWAVLCAEIIAARLTGEPLPVETGLSRHLDSGRFWPLALAEYT
jgi:tRNA 5-methylaminomethyl-2-thiouridine biosynthesis bifunctional protein